MTAQQWIECDDPQAMLDLLAETASRRKLTLAACGCCRRIWHLLVDEQVRNAIVLMERHDDEPLSASALHRMDDEVREATIAHLYGQRTTEHCAASAVGCVVGSLLEMDDAFGHVKYAIDNASTAVGFAFRGQQVTEEELPNQCHLLRHIFGNPFRPYPAPEHWPSAVIQVAHAAYDGQDCRFALHDALLDAGHPDLADHFRQEQAHPKGCWVLDLILGKS